MISEWSVWVVAGLGLLTWIAIGTWVAVVVYRASEAQRDEDDYRLAAMSQRRIQRDKDDYRR